MTANPKNVQPNYDVEDLIKPIRAGLSFDKKLFAVPFYGESSMTFYNKKLFKEAGLEMPAEPTWDQIESELVQRWPADWFFTLGISPVSKICLKRRRSS